MRDGENPATPPRPSLIVRMALRLLLREDERRAALGELRELYERRLVRDGEAPARRWYRRQLRGYPARLLVEWLRGSGRRASERRMSGNAGASGELAGIAGEAKHAVRGWLKSPVLALTVVLTVGLGLGASTAMFAVVRTVLMDPLPYADADRLVRIYHAIGSNRWNVSVADFQAIEAQQTHFDGVAAYSTGERTLTSDGFVERVRVRAVTAGWFELLGMPALVGRTFQPTDGELGAPATAVVSWGFWQRYLGGDVSPLGRTIRLDAEDYTVVGVLPREVGPFEERSDVFPVLQFEPPARKGPFTLTAIGRLRAGADPVAAEAELRAINRRVFPVWQSSWPDSTSTWGMMPLDEFVVGRFRTTLLVLLGAVSLVLLVASTNAAGLLTARATQRRTELATRAALGASRARLIRLLIGESVLLGLAGAALGVALAAVATRAIRAAGPDLLPRAGAIGLDGPVLAFAAMLTAISLIIFGVVPALQWMGSRSAIGDVLRTGGRTATGAAASQVTRRALVASQFTIAVPLLAGAALLMNSFLHLQRVDAGFASDHVVTMRIARANVAPEPAAEAQFWDQLLERVRAVPGVVAAGLNTSRPPTGASNINNFDPLDRPTPAGATEPLAVWHVASPGYFEALGIRLVAGRLFDERDRADLDETSALVDRTWAENIYPGEDVVGRRFYEGGCKSEECNIVTVIGVVENVRYLGLDDAQQGAAVGTVYVPQSQWLASSTYLFVRTAGEPLEALGPIRGIVRSLDPDVPIADVARGTQLIDDALAAPRNLASVVVAFAAVALLLAVIGIYGVMSYFVNEHRADIGVRLALGGKPSQVLGLVIVRGMRPVLAGTAIGFAIAAGVTRYLNRLLFGVSPHDPATLALVAVTMVGTAVLACWLPARHAARMDPARVLRHD